MTADAMDEGPDYSAAIAAWLEGQGLVDYAFRVPEEKIGRTLIKQIAALYPVSTMPQIKHAFRLVREVFRLDTSEEEWTRIPAMLGTIMPEGWRP